MIPVANEKSRTGAAACAGIGGLVANIGRIGAIIAGVTIP